jgi:hypothetical protein
MSDLNSSSIWVLANCIFRELKLPVTGKRTGSWIIDIFALTFDFLVELEHGTIQVKAVVFDAQIVQSGSDLARVELQRVVHDLREAGVWWWKIERWDEEMDEEKLGRWCKNDGTIWMYGWMMAGLMDEW